MRHKNGAEFIMRKANSVKKHSTHLFLSAELIDQAKALDMNLSATLNSALENAVKER